MQSEHPMERDLGSARTTYRWKRVQAATDNSFDSDPFSYGLVVSRQLIEQWFVHATHAGAFCSRSAAIPTDIDTLLRDELPGEMPPGDGDELTLHVQPLIAPRVFLDTTNNLFVFRVFFERIRADLNRTMDGIDIRSSASRAPCRSPFIPG